MVHFQPFILIKNDTAAGVLTKLVSYALFVVVLCFPDASLEFHCAVL